ncbi:MAG: PEGA domain-containing protein [Myxococcales bacterium]|nr:PEGA domain-containing protein [Myxococcales bacterium]
MRRATTALALLLLAGGAASAERVPVAVVWLVDSPAAAATVERALAAAPDLRPLEDPDVRRALSEGGPSAQVAGRIAASRIHLGAQRCGAADTLLAEAEAIALADLPVAEAAVALGEIEPIRLLCADLARDDAAAQRAVRLLLLGSARPTPEMAAAMARHPVPQASPAPAVRVESEPPGAQVYVDLRAVGATPLDLPADRRADALIDLEMPSHRKVHRVAPVAGTLAVALAREDRPGPLVDRLRAARGEAPEAEVAALGLRVGAARVLVMRPQPDHPGQLQARLLDVATARWLRPMVAVPIADAPVRLLAYAALRPEVAPAPAKGVPAATVEKQEPPVPAWKRWYTWVAGGALLALVVGLLVADRIGSDEVTIHVTH